MGLDMVADMEVDKVADIEVDIKADMEVDMVADIGIDIDIDIDIEIQFGERVGHAVWLIGPNMQLYRLVNLLSLRVYFFL